MRSSRTAALAFIASIAPSSVDASPVSLSFLYPSVYKRSREPSTCSKAYSIADKYAADPQGLYYHECWKLHGQTNCPREVGDEIDSSDEDLNSGDSLVVDHPTAADESDTSGASSSTTSAIPAATTTSATSTTVAQTPTTTVYMSKFSVDNLPTGWDSPSRSKFYPQNIIIAFSCFLAVFICFTIAGCVIWRIRVARNRRDLERLEEAKEARLNQDDDDYEDPVVEPAPRSANNSTSNPRRRKKIKLRFRPPKPAEKTDKNLISEKATSSSRVWGITTLRFRPGRRKIIQQAIHPSREDNRTPDNPNPSTDGHLLTQNGRQRSPVVSFADQAASVSPQQPSRQGILPPTPPSPHPIIQPPPQPPELEGPVPPVNDETTLLRGRDSEEEAPPAITATISPPAYHQENSRLNTSERGPEGIRADEDPAYHSRPRSGKERMPDDYMDDGPGLEEFRGIARYPVTSPTQHSTLEPQISSVLRRPTMEDHLVISEPTVPASGVTTVHIATDDKAVLEAIRQQIGDVSFASEPPRESNDRTGPIPHAPAWEEDDISEVPGPSTSVSNNSRPSIFPPPPGPIIQSSSASASIYSPFQLPSPPPPLSQTLSATELPVYIGSDTPLSDNKQSLNQADTWLLPSAPPIEPSTPSLPQLMDSSLPIPSAPMLLATDEEDGTLNDSGVATSVPVSDSESATTTNLLRVPPTNLPKYEP